MDLKLKQGGDGLNPIAKILFVRDTSFRFLHPKQDDELPYTDLENIDIAARRILKAIVRQE